ncbi:MAG TPA: glycosyltransferase family 25 protein [Acetobacteraceae bacterium]|jgi:GR25 family glycosyltransferase involved in LPS biosynthesis|nr:glycosyltransferase family 25 protein [Acetobacteraceae bacterium]
MPVISLACTPERLTRFRATNPHIAAGLLPAIDGRAVGYVGFLPAHLPWTPGAVGCMLSHLTFWDQVIAANRPTTVFEDDAIIHHRFIEHSSAILAALPENWDICLWGWNFDAPMVFDPSAARMRVMTLFNQDELRANPAAFQAGDIRPFAPRLRRFHGTVSYAVSPAGAATLRRLCIPIRDMEIDYPGARLPNAGIDRAINATLDQMEAFVCFPPLVATENRHETSTVLDVSGGSPTAQLNGHQRGAA